MMLNKNTYTLGRSATCDIVMEESKIPKNYHASISKVHLTLNIDTTSNILYLIDSSKNGTFVSGVRVEKNTQVHLKNKAKIAVGQKDLNVYTVQVIENLPDTLSPAGVYISPSIQSKILPIWGRLIPCMMYLNSYDLLDNEFRVGRSMDCDVPIVGTKLSKNVKNIFSKEHFVIYKETNPPVTLIKDLSKTGTYLNNHLIGKNNTNILQSDDIISIGKTKLELFLYKSMLPEDLTYLPPDLNQIYVPSRILGSGAAGEVRLAFEKRTCDMVAIKKILKSRSTVSQLYRVNHPTKIHTEISILRNLKHPFVIRMKDIVETPEEVYIVLEYMRGGELTNRILSNDPLRELNTKFLFYQIVLAVEYLHSKGITHRDLKPDNVLLQSEDVETLVKVSDFGLSKVTEGNDMMRTVCGTMCYIAPEMLDSNIKEYNKQVDVWSMGVILYYMLSKKLPFNCSRSSDRSVMVEQIKNGSFKMEDNDWREVSAHAVDLVKQMLTVDPQKRISMVGILNHPWLAKDTLIKYKVQSLLESNFLELEGIVMTYDLEPPPKRIRLASEESTA